MDPIFSRFKKKSSVQVRWLWRECVPYRRTLVSIGCLLILSAVMVLGLVRYIRSRIDTPMMYDLHQIVQTVGVLCAWVFSLSVLTYTRYCQSARIVTALITRWRRMLFKNALQQPFSFWNHTPTSRVTYISETECKTLENVGLHVLPHAFRHAVTFLGAVILLGVYHIQLSFIFLLGLLLCFLPLRFLVTKSREHYGSIRHLEEILNQRVAEVFRALFMIHVTGQHKEEYQALHTLMDAHQKASDVHAAVRGRLIASIVLLTGVVVVILGGWSFLQVSQQRLLMGDALGFLLYAVLVAASLNGLAEAMPHMQGAFKILEHVRFWVELPVSEEKSMQKEDSMIPGSSPSLTLDHVSYHYSSSENPLVLQDVSFTIPWGSKVAVIGPSGSGKTTLLSLLLGLHIPSSGTLRVGSCRPHQLSPQKRGCLLGLAPQEPILLTRTVREHLTYGASATWSDSELWGLIEDIDLLDWVQDLPQQMETLLGPHTLNASVGQKQRLMLGRLRVQNPDIFLLDEATSGLDVSTEKTILECLKKWTHAKTCFMVTHKLSLIQDMDIILFLHRGRLTGMGSHQDLLKSHTLYKSFVALQWPTEARVMF